MRILILGATSTIARATAAKLAARGAELYLAGRDQAALERLATDFHIRYNVSVAYGQFDIEDFGSHAGFWQDVLTKMGSLDGVFFAIGCMGTDYQKIIAVNFTGAVSILNQAADYFMVKKHGFIAAISSVAGDRGRQSNYLYGAAKAGLSVYLQGLRNKLFPYDVRVITIKPGLVDTAMIFGLPQMKYAAKPDRVARDIVRGINKRQDIIYTPWFWNYIMAIVKIIPERIFKRLNL